MLVPISVGEITGFVASELVEEWFPSSIVAAITPPIEALNNGVRC